MIREIDQYNLHKTFRFNLISREKEIEIEQFKQRDDTILLFFALLFISSLGFVFLTLIDVLFIQSRINQLQNNERIARNNLEQIDQILTSHGELITKSQLLKEAISKDVSFDTLFQIINTSISIEGLQVISYERITNGAFLVNVKHNSLNETKAISDQLNLINEIDYSRINRVARLSDNSFQTQFELLLK